MKIINLLNSVYSLSFNGNMLMNKLKLNSLIRFLIRHISNVIIPLILKFHFRYKYVGYKTKGFDKRIIVSLTTFPKRISYVWMVIYIILHQTIKPDFVFLYLSAEQFPNRYDDLPKSLLRLISKGLTIVFVDGDIKSHKKYFYSFSSFPDDIIITVDDDIFYPLDMIEELVNLHIQYPNSVICRYGRDMCVDGHISYCSKRWKHIFNSEYKLNTIFLGTGGGTLFPSPKDIFFDDIYDIDLALMLAPLEDDLWINTMLRLNNTPIIISKKYKDILPIIIKGDVKLFSKNGGENKTDKQLLDIISYYSSLNKYPYKLNI